MLVPVGFDALQNGCFRRAKPLNGRTIVRNAMQPSLSKRTLVCAVWLSAWDLAETERLPAQPVVAKQAVSTNYVLAVVQGTVQVSVGGTAPWSAASQGQVLRPGDRIKTGRYSRAAVYLAEDLVTELGEYSTCGIKPSPGLAIEAGLVKTTGREKRRTDFDMPRSKAAIRGTDFVIKVTDGQTEFTVLDGEVELSNPLGSVVLTNGQQGVAADNTAPRLTAVLKAEAVNDLIEWALYYPGVLDVDECLLRPRKGMIWRSRSPCIEMVMCSKP